MVAVVIHCYAAQNQSTCAYLSLRKQQTDNAVDSPKGCLPERQQDEHPRSSKALVPELPGGGRATVAPSSQPGQRSYSRDVPALPVGQRQPAIVLQNTRACPAIEGVRPEWTGGDMSTLVYSL